jgi:hypothetical protein
MFTRWMIPAVALFALPAAAQEFRLPLACGAEGCFVQNFSDHDAGPGAADPVCGVRTYDGHDGLDLRVTGAEMRRGVDVLAPAAGVVRGVRDGEADGAYLASGKSAVADRECGNGVAIDHGGGWSSQLCHLKRGSVRVKAGDKVAAGQAVGQAGLSGFTQFPHVHLTLRLNGEKVEPLTGKPIGEVSCARTGLAPGPHWSAGAKTSLGVGDARWFEAGFAGEAPAKDPSLGVAGARRDGAAFVFWALAVGPKSGDVLKVRLTGPDGKLVAESERTQPRDQAQAWLFAGKKAPAGGWPVGLYVGEAQLIRAGRVVDTHRAEQRF